MCAEAVLTWKLVVHLRMDHFNKKNVSLVGAVLQLKEGSF